MKPLVSVITPAWNRGSYLKTVWAALKAQTFRNFEWVVANDGSTDDTIETVRSLAKQSDFPVTLISASQRVGKSRIDNEAVSEARGEFIIWCDSDDFFFPNALEVLVNTWESIPACDREYYCGITALCDTEDGVLGNRFYNEDGPLDMTWNDLFDRLHSDLVIFTRAELLKNNPFLEVDFLISESSVWRKIGVLKTRFTPVVLERKRYREANALSYSGHMSYNRGHAYALALTKESALKNLGPISRIRRKVNYLRYCRHGDIPLRQAFELWRAGLLEGILLSILWPASQLVSLKDTMQGKVRKTHLEFLAAKKSATIKTEKVNFVE